MKSSATPTPNDSRVLDTVMLRNTDAVLSRMFRGGKPTDTRLRFSWRQWTLLAAVVIIPVVWFVVLAVSPWAHAAWGSPSAHIILELFESAIALCVLYVSVSGYLESGSPRVFFVALGFLSLIVLDLFHIGLPLSTTSSVWTRTLSLAVGAAFFLCAALSQGSVPARLTQRERAWALVRVGAAAVAIAALGMLCVALGDELPQALGPKGYSWAIIGTRWVAGALVLWAAAIFLRDYQQGGGAALYALSLMLLLLFQSIVIFGFSSLMDVTWWSSHVIRLAGYLLLLVGLTMGFVDSNIQLARLAAELKRAEDLALREQASLRVIFDSISDELVVLDTQGVIQNVNAEAVRRHGDAALPDYGLIGRSCFEVFHGRDTSCPNCPLEETLRTGRPLQRSLHKHRTRDGQEHLAEIVGGPIRDHNGQVLGAVVMMRDVTERENVVEALRRERDFNERLIQTAEVLIVGLDLQGNITLFNRKCEEVTGYEAAEVVGRPLWERLIPERFIIPVKHVLARLKADVLPSEFENPWLTRAGEERWIAWHNTNIKDKDGNVVSIIGIGVDITERKMAEESAHLLSSVVEQSASPLVMTTFEGEIVRFNRAFQTLTGYSERELRRMTFRDLLPHYRRDFEVQKRAEVVASGKPVTYEEEILHKDGHVIPIEVVTGIYRDDKGIPQYLYSWMRDLTDQKRAEQERRRYLDELVQIEKMNALGSLAAGLVHQFNNLLGAVLGYTSLLKTKLEPGHPLLGPLDVIEKCSRRGAELTRQISSFVRTGKFSTEVVNPNRVVGRLLSLISQSWGPPYQIESHLRHDIWPIEADSGQLVHALLNICLNARDAMPRGGRLVIETQNVMAGETFIRTHPEARLGPYVVLSVTDSGAGMDAETLRHIFEPFFTTKEGRNRVGLGLSVAYRIVKSHGGFITVYSEVGKGSCFKIYLPATAAQMPPEEVKAPLARGTETILLVEDEEVVRTAGVDMLEHLGYTVLQAAHGREALDIYRRHRDEVALVILDMIMPEMTGRETLEALRRVNPQVKVLLASGYNEPEQVRQILEAGARAFIQKPFHIEELAKAVRRVLDEET